jgi:hypothetical protein
MKNYILAVISTVLMNSAYATYANGIIPAGAMLPARVSRMDEHSVRAQVVAPKEQGLSDTIAAAVTGCVVYGSRAFLTHDRIHMQFDILKCAGRRAIPIKAVAVSRGDHQVGLHALADVGTPMSILLLDSVKTP